MADFSYRKLAAESIEWKCHKCGVASNLLPELRPKGEGDGASSSGTGKSSYADQIKELHKLKAKTAGEVAAESAASPGTAATAISSSEAPGGETDVKVATAGSAGATSSERSGESGGGSDTTVVAGVPSSPRLRSVGGAPAEGGNASSASPADGDETHGGEGEHGVQQQQQQRQEQEAVVSAPEREDDMLSFFAVAIALAIVGILVRKALRHYEVF